MLNKILYTLTAVVVLFTSCQKDYVIGGKNEDESIYKNTLTYDVLKQDPVYDSLIQLIDAAGLQNDINEANTTLFAPSDFAIFNYLNDRTRYVQSAYGDTKKFGMDSLKYYLQNNINGTKDSLKLYIVKPALNYSDLTTTGRFYETGLPNKKVIVSYEETRDPNMGYNPLVSTVPRLVYLSYLTGNYNLSDQNPASDIPSDLGYRVLCKTSGILTKNGIIDELEPAHTLFFADWPDNISN
ncbi:hypothetical protein A8C56_12090 [Niabella ginsenosidivorans]|uniref:FAS1 domain-containing protein n=1 Tax=Niabella ginsenosidivorans TaxID=1176587 RepID=A0A1A9I3J0_9BACT|nr:fasciclin domain-containing protein [Niabella ginsenosidivorans]ANH81619.1 hypothetical protein A8C56_12090 [Niabella ginsenosidivorans]